MKDAESWVPSKYAIRSGRLAASMDESRVSMASRLNVNLTAKFYEYAISKFARGDLLDLGCGNAPLYATYRKFCRSVQCVDWQNTLHKNRHLDLECDLNQAIPLPTESFDTIVLSDVLEHLYAPEHLCSEIARLLRPGGALIMNVPFMYWLHEVPHDYHRYTEFALRRLMTMNGLDPVKLVALGGSTDVILDIVSKRSLARGRIGRWMCRVLSFVGEFRARKFSIPAFAEAAFESFPLGYGMVALKRA